MTALRNRRPEAGVTIVEIMVVVVITGTLLAIAVPTLTGSRAKAQDATAQRALRTSLTAADVIYTDHRSFADADGPALAKVTPTLRYVDGDAPSTTPGSVSVANDRDTWSGATQSDSGTCFLISADGSGRVRYGSTIQGPCTGVAARSGAHSTTW